MYAEEDDAVGDETDPVVAYREEELHRAGYPEFWAVELARRSDIDLHLAVSLVERGCSPDLAAEILR